MADDENPMGDVAHPSLPPQAKKWILRTLALCIFNVIVLLLAGRLCAILLFGGDAILAGVIALLMLPAILLQPWSILFTMGVGLLAESSNWKYYIVLTAVPVLTSVVSVLLWYLLDRMGRLERIKPFAARLKTRKALVAIGCAIFWLCAIAYARHVDFPAFNRTVPKLITNRLKDANVIFAHPFCWGEVWLDAEYYVRANVSERDMQIIVDKLQMHSIPLSNVPISFWHRQQYWWRPERSEDIRIFSTTELPEMEKGQHCEIYALWNPKDNVLHMSIFSE